MVRTIDWDDGAVVIVDQVALPDELHLLRLATVDELIDAIQRLAVRGAPALGAAGALGVALAVQQAGEEGWDAAALDEVIERLRRARPTAVNLSWGIDRVLPVRRHGLDAVVREACAVLDEDARANRALGGRGADLLEELCPDLERFRLQTHCNAGALACVEWGTALGVVRTVHERGRLDSVLAGETRPLLQGARLTAWELQQLGVKHHVIVDSAGPSCIARGMVDAVVVGADRVTANGDVANKIGTYPLALAAARAGIPFIVAAPESTLDSATPDGARIEIEDRHGDEVVVIHDRRTAPTESPAHNPAFDVTPADLVTAIVTETRTIRPAHGETVA
jgi:S-methyl-5-thioribose-1-phosphate isomerase